MKPTQILEKLCKDYKLDTPNYRLDSVMVGGQTFHEKPEIELQSGNYFNIYIFSLLFSNYKLTICFWSMFSGLKICWASFGILYFLQIYKRYSSVSGVGGVGSDWETYLFYCIINVLQHSWLCAYLFVQTRGREIQLKVRSYTIFM